MDTIPRFKKIEVLSLGIVLPVLLSGYTVLLLLNSEAVFWGRSSTVIYQGDSAFFVSLLWFGVSGLLAGHFWLRHLRLLRPSRHRVLMWASLILVLVGLASAISLV
ncbi:hypothetical protein [Marinobacter shengliensis]|uniref:Uncharacterized protein n=1 Tax=Marinobacter shengliensis TaxID=1389223 RepID=A0ABV4W6A9_9GAMM